MKYLLSIQNPSTEMTRKFDFVLIRTFWLADEEMHQDINETPKTNFWIRGMNTYYCNENPDMQYVPFCQEWVCRYIP